MCTNALYLSRLRTAASYIGTVPTGTSEAAMTRCRVSTMRAPVLRSITVSDPQRTATRSFSSSSSMLS